MVYTYVQQKNVIGGIVNLGSRMIGWVRELVLVHELNPSPKIESHILFSSNAHDYPKLVILFLDL